MVFGSMSYTFVRKLMRGFAPELSIFGDSPLDTFFETKAKQGYTRSWTRSTESCCRQLKNATPDEIRKLPVPPVAMSAVSL